jgi:hypothetical protein
VDRFGLCAELALGVAVSVNRAGLRSCPQTLEIAYVLVFGLHLNSAQVPCSTVVHLYSFGLGFGVVEQPHRTKNMRTMQKAMTKMRYVLDSSNILLSPIVVEVLSIRTHQCGHHPHTGPKSRFVLRLGSGGGVLQGSCRCRSSQSWLFQLSAQLRA